ncbi:MULTISPECIES: hypothetical protein [Bacillus cereus group]|uniref:hypothetical protein n=1 Tax=Bacillus cereus group TaxID=86661 RepID=UPI0022E48464|nr:hypothetical protein [Bacillus cereus]MDF9630505.1 hypothetical protein [Bacillus cereus]MDF9635155.1 hypothetical protein [Bacillus cereus]MDG1583619.1 hypothetical protein [Bacillus cereus]MDZ4503315.1 hypothetical protein [Bacillus cereus]WKT32993.1 hypothetical protein QPK55_09330 [Bacillus cereus]
MCQRKTGLSTLALLFNYAMISNKEQREVFYVQSIVLEAAGSLISLFEDKKLESLLDLNTG